MYSNYPLHATYYSTKATYYLRVGLFPFFTSSMTMAKIRSRKSSFHQRYVTYKPLVGRGSQTRYIICTGDGRGEVQSSNPYVRDHFSRPKTNKLLDNTIWDTIPNTFYYDTFC